MSDTKREDSDEGSALERAEPSVIEFLRTKTGDAPRVTLRDEDSGAVSAPLIDPRSSETAAVPHGRGNYQLMGEIARGGMGVILKGHDTDLGRDVAVKVLDKRLAERPDVVQRFVEEAQIGGQLQHPGIVPVYELGLMADERPYFTMKLVKGRTLATLLTERASATADRRRLIDVFESVCQTMAYAHSRGVIHRDLKPANIMVGAFGEVQVVDWGLAKVMARGGTADEKRAREAHSNLTILETVRSDGSGSGSASMVGSILGTPAYMPPEQASGLVDRLDERSDVFALGAILCEILTGKPPYVGERNEVIAAAAQADYQGALERLDACEADPDLVKLTKQCLLAAPAARPANAGAVAERVHEYSVTVEERAHAAQVEAAEARVRVREEQKARRLTLALGGSVAAILLVLVGGWSYLSNERAERERAEAARVAEEALRASELAADVNGTLNEASVLQVSERWDDAILVAERARAMAEGGGAGPELMDRVDGVLEDLRGGREEELAREERARDTEALLAELNAEREPDWGALAGDAVAQAGRESDRIRQTFADHGIDLEAGTEEEAARQLTDRGLGAEVALILDGWVQQLQRTGEHDSAERILAIAHSVDPDPLRADLREALARGELEVLQWIADQGFDLQPPGTIELLGTALERLDDRDTAREVYRAGVDLHADAFGLQFRLGRLLVPGGIQIGEPLDLAEGLASLQAALALRPRSDLVRFHLGRAHSKMGRHDRALEQFDALRERSPDDQLLTFQVAFELMQLGRSERSLELYRELQDVRRPDWIGRFSRAGIGECLRQLGRFDEAAGWLEEVIHWGREQVPDWQESLFRIYEAEEGSLAGAVARVEAEFPLDANYHNNLGWMLIVQHPSPEGYALAETLAQRAVELEPLGVHWNTLGVARYYLGHPEEALEALHESVRLGGWHVVDSMLIAMSEHALGQEDAAEAEYQRALDWIEANDRLDPEFVRFREDARQVFGR